MLQRKQNGVTLIELIVGIAVLAIIIGLALPGFTSVLQNSRSAAISNELVSAIQLARSEALKRAVDVNLCPTVNQASCGGSWNDGWLVRLADGTALQSWQRPLGGGGFEDVGELPALIGFTATGRTTLSATTVFALRIPGCTRDANRDVTLSPTGRVSIARVDCES